MAVNYITLRGSQFRWLPVIQVPTGTGNETPSHVAACGVRSLIRTKRLLCERGLRRLGPELRIAVEALDLRTEVASPFPGFGLCDQLGLDHELTKQSDALRAGCGVSASGLLCHQPRPGEPQIRKHYLKPCLRLAKPHPG